jgi:hypothetical protein
VKSGADPIRAVGTRRHGVQTGAGITEAMRAKHAATSKRRTHCPRTLSADGNAELVTGFLAVTDPQMRWAPQLPAALQSAPKAPFLTNSRYPPASPFRSPVHGRQMPGKANNGRSWLSANQCGTFEVESVHSQKLVAGTRQRHSGFSQPFENRLNTLRTLVIGRVPRLGGQRR